MQKIFPHLWFDKEAREAAAFYTSIFPESRITHTNVLRDTPSGDCDVVSFELWNQRFMAISAGPLFRFNPSVSFMVNFDPLFFGSGAEATTAAGDKLTRCWEKLAEGGNVLMPLNEYPFSKLYGWVADKYGLSWQLILTDPDGEPRPPVIPSLLFTGDKAGKAEEAIAFYTSVFKDTRTGGIHRYPAGMEPEKEGSVMFADFMLEQTWFAAMDSAQSHGFDFNESVSFMVNCRDQAEIDYYWERLSAVPEAEQCGWLKDKYGLSWQVTAATMQTMMQQATPGQLDRIVQAFLPMKKLDLAQIEAAYRSAEEAVRQ